MRRQRDIVIHGFNILIPAARRLRRKQQIAPALRGENEERLSGFVAPDHRFALLRLAPFGDDLGAQTFRQLIEPHAILGNGQELHATGTRKFVQFDGDIRSRHGIVSERADGSEQFIGVGWRTVRRKTIGAQPVENLQQRLRQDVQIRRANAFPPRRIIVVNDRDAAFVGRFVPQLHPCLHAVGEPFDAVGNGHGHHIVFAGGHVHELFFGGNNRRRNRAREFRAADLPGALNEVESAGGALPFGAALTVLGNGIDDRIIQLRQQRRELGRNIANFQRQPDDGLDAAVAVGVEK